jgi:hypothetical protein
MLHLQSIEHRSCLTSFQGGEMPARHLPIDRFRHELHALLLLVSAAPTLSPHEPPVLLPVQLDPEYKSPTAQLVLPLAEHV